MQKIKLSNKPFCNDFHFLFIGVVCLLLSLKFPIFIILLFSYFFFIWKKTRLIIPLAIIITLVFISYSLANYKLQPKSEGKYKDVFQVVESSETTLILKSDFKCIVYDSTKTLLPGDIIEGELQVYSLSEASYLGDFDEKNYYNAKGITNRGKLLNYKKIGQKMCISRLKWHWLSYYEKRLDEKSFSYLKALIFGINDLEKSIKKAYASLYISHLLAISGLHINFMYYILVKLFQRVFKIEGEKLAVGILGVYVIFIGYPVACLRAFLFLFLQLWNQKGRLQYTKLDILSISYIGMVFIFPLKAFQMGFILSFLISFILIFVEDFYHGHSKIKKNMVTSYLCILTILPFLINQTHTISVLGIGLSFILGYGMSKLLLPLIFLTLFFPNKYYEYIFKGVDNLLSYFSNQTFPFSISHMSLFWVIFYYIIFIYILICMAKRRKKFTIFYIFLFFLLMNTINKTNIFYKVTFIDVGQGDSILIELPFNQGKILVDSYNNIDYLKSRGISSLDYVIITHFDQDHMGSLLELSKSFKIKKLFYSSYEDVKKISHINAPKVAICGGESISIGNVYLHFIGPLHNYKDSNSNSLVLFFKLNIYSFLLTGDMTSEAEKDLIKRYSTNLKCDVLKVGHHGSSTSSSEEFLKYCLPSYSIVSVGKNNSYGLPDDKVINRLKTISKIYETKDCGNIEVLIGDSIKIMPYRSSTL